MAVRHKCLVIRKNPKSGSTTAEEALKETAHERVLVGEALVRKLTQ